MQATSAYPQARPLQLLGGQVLPREIAWIQHFSQTPEDRLELGEVGQSSSASPPPPSEAPGSSFPLRGGSSHDLVNCVRAAAGEFQSVPPPPCFSPNSSSFAASSAHQAFLSTLRRKSRSPLLDLLVTSAPTCPFTVQIQLALIRPLPCVHLSPNNSTANCPNTPGT